MAGCLNINAVLKKYGLKPKAQWSQNFLVDREVLDIIVEAADLDHHRIVIELGAGIGVLSAMLAKKAGKVVAVERDRDLASLLRSEFALDPVVEVLEANAAGLKYGDLVEGFESRPVVVGNLPYHMATPILFHLLEHRNILAHWILMFQKEVADRLVAEPGNRTYGIITVLLQPYVEIEKVLEVSPRSFFPSPKVRSCVLRIKPLDKPRLQIREPKLFEQVVKAAFRQRRKKLLNALLAAFERQVGRVGVKQALGSAEVDGELRAEQLSGQMFAKLSDAFCDQGLRIVGKAQ